MGDGAIESREYVLKELDRWYAGRVKKHLTREHAEIIAEKFKEALDSAGIPDDIKKNMRIDAQKDGFFYDHINTSAESYFSRTYATMEAFMESEESGGGIKLEYIPKGAKEEYFDLALKTIKQIKMFVDAVRGEAGEKFPDEISDDDINRAFLRTFKDSEGFTKFSNGAFDSALLILEYAVISGKESREMFNFTEKYFSLIKPIMPQLSRAVFGDLEKML